jgi:hypothetical protein
MLPLRKPGCAGRLTGGRAEGMLAGVQFKVLSPEAKLDAACVAATEDMTPAYVAVLRQIEPGVRVQQGFRLWRMARDALIRQELRRGRPLEDARRVAAERMLRIDHDSAA